MSKKRYIFPFLLLMYLCHAVMGQANAYDVDWTEKKLGKVIMKADKAARQKKWPRALKLGEQMLKGSLALDQKNAPRYINLLKTLNRYYDNSNRLEKVMPRVKDAYILSQKYLGTTHQTTIASRLLYYKVLISQKKYSEAIPLVQENIFILKKSREDDFRRLHYMKQLYSLYGSTKQYDKEEETLRNLLILNKKLLGNDLKENLKIILSLARTYCLQEKTDDFKELMQTYSLNYKC